MDSKEQVARWLRDELKKVREGDPFSVLSRIQIADAAMTMVESWFGLDVTHDLPPDGPGANLLGLVRELLGVDVHRADFAKQCGVLENCALNVVTARDVSATTNWRGGAVSVGSPFSTGDDQQLTKGSWKSRARAAQRRSPRAEGCQPIFLV